MKFYLQVHELSHPFVSNGAEEGSYVHGVNGKLM